GNFFMEINPLEGLRFRTQYGIDFRNRRSFRMLMPSASWSKGMGNRRETNGQRLNQTITNTLEYQFNIDHDHNFSILAGQEGIKYDYEEFGVNVRGMSDDRLMEFTAGNVSEMKQEDISMLTSQ